MNWFEDIRTGVRKLEQNPKSLRKFALTMAGAVIVLATIIFLLSSHPQRAFPLWAVGVLFLIAGFIKPLLLKNIHTVWMAFALALGWIMSRVILTILFFVVITPIGLIMRLFGKDPMSRKINPDASTFWIKREQKTTDPAQYERQF